MRLSTKLLKVRLFLINVNYGTSIYYLENEKYIDLIDKVSEIFPEIHIQMLFKFVSHYILTMVYLINKECKNK